MIDPEASVMVNGRLLWCYFDRKHVCSSRVKFHDEVDHIAILMPPAFKREGAEIDRFLLQELKAQFETRNSEFRAFDLIVEDTNLWIFRDNRMARDAKLTASGE